MQHLLQNRPKYFFLVLLLSTLPWTSTYATDCEDIQVSSTNTAVKITGLTAPIEIVKLFDANWNSVYSCSNNCTEEILIDNLAAGEYHIQAQFFDKDWKGLCDRTIDISVGDCICPAIYMPVCGTDGVTYSNACAAACAGVEVIAEGECAPVTTCDLLARITLNPDLCSQCLSEIAVFSLDGKSYLVSLADNINCSDALTTVVDCDTGEEFCREGGIAGFTCGDFFDKAEKIEIVLEDDCTPCICTREYQPVCGVDGKTYGNKCEADCAGVEIAYEGECEPCICTEEYQPVCGVDGKTYSNKCFAECAGVEIAHEGECEPCICPAVYDPVCGEDGKTYGNACEAACAGVEIEAEGECAPCICPTDAMPVCGIDGNTYTNACKAACAGVEVAFEGICAECLGEPIPDVACTQEFDPVCGCDGKTYSNACMAQIAGIKSWTAGACEDPCIGEPNVLILCTEEYIPVCGCDGKTYGNDCMAQQAGVKKWTEGPCDCICPDVWDPVCGVDGKTYGNECEARCAGVEIASEGECDACIGEPNPLILCAQVYIPVCGCDGKTYGNDCMAEQAGVKEWTAGPCGCACPENYDPVCGVDGKTYGNKCEAECVGIEVAYEGECEEDNRCDLLNLIDLNPDLCGQCLTEIAIYKYKGKNYLVSLADNIACADGLTTVVECATGAAFCQEGGIAGFSCGDFFKEAEKIETIIQQDCECYGLPTPGAPCPEVYDPVCGCDGETYENACRASSLGIKKWTAGKCASTVIECGEITITYDSKQIEMKGLAGNNYFFKIHDKKENWKEVFNCAANCGAIQTAILPTGDYYVKIYDANWNQICEQDITLAVDTEPIDGRFRCEDATITYGDGKVKLVGNPDKKYHLKVIDSRYHDVFACMWNCGSTIIAENIPRGRYLVRVMDADYQVLCEESIRLSNPNNAGVRGAIGFGLTAYPNPATKEIFINLKELHNQSGVVKVLNTYGQEMTSQNFENHSGEAVRLDVNEYQNGLYYYQIQLPKQPLITGKFLVNRLY